MGKEAGKRGEKKTMAVIVTGCGTGDGPWLWLDCGWLLCGCVCGWLAVSVLSGFCLLACWLALLCSIKLPVLIFIMRSNVKSYDLDAIIVCTEVRCQK